ncbi:hypothetical protein BRADI_1g69823v3 [Brachypodium distachyon]|uniref:Uncharacterized protein n=1 Tax=Brachypodium distachyon TaxID=15368 RepID=A0A2K2DUB2_BRADI|nr:hypothetical protein BRADI_1g69823v3 [Brachypodium distachyon]
MEQKYHVSSARHQNPLDPCSLNRWETNVNKPHTSIWDYGRCYRRCNTRNRWNLAPSD